MCQDMALTMSAKNDYRPIWKESYDDNSTHVRYFKQLMKSPVDNSMQ